MFFKQINFIDWPVDINNKVEFLTELIFDYIEENKKTTIYKNEYIRKADLNIMINTLWSSSETNARDFYSYANLRKALVFFSVVTEFTDRMHNYDTYLRLNYGLINELIEAQNLKEITNSVQTKQFYSQDDSYAISYAVGTFKMTIDTNNPYIDYSNTFEDLLNKIELAKRVGKKLNRLLINYDNNIDFQKMFECFGYKLAIPDLKIDISTKDLTWFVDSRLKMIGAVGSGLELEIRNNCFKKFNETTKTLGKLFIYLTEKEKEKVYRESIIEIYQKYCLKIIRAMSGTNSFNITINVRDFEESTKYKQCYRILEVEMHDKGNRFNF